MDFTLTQHVKVLEGPGSINHIGQLMLTAGYKKAFLVCDSGITKLGISDAIRSNIRQAGLSCTIYDKVIPDPPSEIIDEGASLCQASGCDCVIAVGGGSSIDTAKGINILRFNEGHILDYAIPGSIKNAARGLICIPTTAGTGSELSNGLIISDMSKEKKVPILAVEGMSEYALLDPELTIGMPAGLTAMTGLDVFSHACEAYTSILGNDVTSAICEKVMADVVEFLPRAVKNGKDIAARERMMSAASLGGWMLASASAHFGHSIAHVLGAKFHLPHGQACMLSMPAVFYLLQDVCMEKNMRIGRILGASFEENETSHSIAEKTSQAYQDFCTRLGMKACTLSRPCPSDMDELTYAVLHEPLSAICPVALTVENVRPLLENLFSE